MWPTFSVLLAQPRSWYGWHIETYTSLHKNLHRTPHPEPFTIFNTPKSYFFSTGFSIILLCLDLANNLFPLKLISQNFVFISHLLWPSLWSSGQSSWLQIQRSGFASRRYQIFWEEVVLERGPLSLVSTLEQLLEIKSICSGLENRDYGRRDSSRWQRGTL
jgi:hypothetical protein